MLACPSCHRQFDVSDLAVGAKVRCLCGTLMTVPEVKARDMVMQRCASCGGDIAEGADECQYCGSDVSMADRGSGGTCPGCYSRLAKGARFCCSCGLKIEVTSKLQPLHDKPCPRCDGQLAVQEFADGSLVECTDCGGIWLEEDEFEKISSDRERNAVAKFVTGRSEGDSSEPMRLESSVKYLKCPTCQELMHRKNFGRTSGVIVDWCKGHGYWFDNQELERILHYIRGGGLERSRERDLELLQSSARRSGTKPVMPLLPGSERSLFLGHRHEASVLDVLGGFLRKLF